MPSGPVVYGAPPVVYSAPPVVYAPAPTVIYQAPIVPAPPVFGATVVIGGHGGYRYGYGHGPRVFVRGRW